MKYRFLSLMIVSFFWLPFHFKSQAQTFPTLPQTASFTDGRLPLFFEPNQGQCDPQVKFLARGSGYSLFLTGQEAVWALRMKTSGADSRYPGIRGKPSFLSAPRVSTLHM